MRRMQHERNRRVHFSSRVGSITPGFICDLVVLDCEIYAHVLDSQALRFHYGVCFCFLREETHVCCAYTEQWQ